MPEWDYREKRYLSAEEIADREQRVRDHSERYEEYLRHKDEPPPFNWSGVFKGLFTASVIFGVAALVFSIKPDKSKPDPAVAALKVEVERARLDAKFQTSEMKEKLEKAEAELKTAKEKAENLADEKSFLEAKLNELKPKQSDVSQKQNDALSMKTRRILAYVGLSCTFLLIILVGGCVSGTFKQIESYSAFPGFIIGVLGVIFLIMGAPAMQTTKSDVAIQVPSNPVIEISSKSGDCTLHENCKVVVRNAKITDVKQEGLKTMIYVEMEDGKKGSWGVSPKFLALRKHLIGEKIPIYEHYIEKVIQKERPAEKKEEPKKTKEPRLEWL